jgi:hypothetical protein
MFDTVFKSIVMTLKMAFKEALTKPIASAWTWLYTLMSDLMLSAHRVCLSLFLAVSICLAVSA